MMVLHREIDSTALLCIHSSNTVVCVGEVGLGSLFFIYNSKILDSLPSIIDDNNNNTVVRYRRL